MRVVIEETEQNMRSESNLPEPVNLEQRMNEEAETYTINSKVLKNNYLMNSGPIGATNVLDMDSDVKYSKTKHFKNNSSIAKAKRNSDYKNIFEQQDNQMGSYFKNKRSAIVDKPPIIMNKRSQRSKSNSDLNSHKYASLEHDHDHISIKQKYIATNDDQDYEIKANGMMKIKKKKKQNDEKAYMSKRLKNQPGLNSSSGSVRYTNVNPLDMLRQHEKHLPDVNNRLVPNLVIQNPTSNIITAPISYPQNKQLFSNRQSESLEEEFKNLPSPSILSSKYKNKLAGLECKCNIT